MLPNTNLPPQHPTYIQQAVEQGTYITVFSASAHRGRQRNPQRPSELKSDRVHSVKVNAYRGTHSNTYAGWLCCVALRRVAEMQLW